MTGLLLYCRDETGTVYPADVSPSATVWDLKKAVEACGVGSANSLQLSYAGRALHDSDPLAETGISSEAQVDLRRAVVPVRGQLLLGAYPGPVRVCGGRLVTGGHALPSSPERVVELAQGCTIGYLLAILEGGRLWTDREDLQPLLDDVCGGAVAVSAWAVSCGAAVVTADGVLYEFWSSAGRMQWRKHAFKGKRAVAVAAVGRSATTRMKGMFSRGGLRCVVLFDDGTLGSVRADLPAAADAGGGRKKVTKIAAGGVHWMFMYDDGAVAFSGQDICGCCRAPPLPGRVIDIACGAAHSVALCEDGSVHAWGSHHTGCSASDQCAVPPLDAPAVSVHAGAVSTAAILQNGDFKLWGEY